MARHPFGANPSDWAFTVAGDGLTPQLASGAVLTLWNQQSSGTQIADLSNDAEGLEPITTLTASDGTDGYAPGQVPQFYGPDNETLMWLSADGGSRLKIQCTDLADTVASLDSLVDDLGTVQLRGGGNFIPNPSFGDSLTGWTAQANGTLALDTANGIFGPNCGKVTRNHSAGTGSISAISPTGAIEPSVRYSVTGWVRLGSLGGLVARTATLITHWYDSGMASVRDDTSPVFTESIQGTWLQVMNPNLQAPDAAAFVTVELVVAGVAADEFHFFDGFQLEPGGMPTSFNGNYAASTLSGGMLVPASITVRETAPGSAKPLAGVAASRPAAGTAGRLYFATDTGALSYDNGTSWASVGGGGGGGFTGPWDYPFTIDPRQFGGNTALSPTADTLYWFRLTGAGAVSGWRFRVGAAVNGAVVGFAVYNSTGSGLGAKPGTKVASSDTSATMVGTGAADYTATYGSPITVTHGMWLGVTVSNAAITLARAQLNSGTFLSDGVAWQATSSGTGPTFPSSAPALSSYLQTPIVVGVV